jgi:uncharacterized protein YjbJ (UPF0337 family)
LTDGESLAFRVPHDDGRHKYGQGGRAVDCASLKGKLGLNESIEKLLCARPSVGGSIGEKIMDKDRIKGSAKEIKGKIMEVAGKALGDAKLDAEGKAEQAAGKVQNTVGGIKDTLKGK